MKMTGGRMDTPHSIPLDPSLAISCANDRKSLVYFSRLAPLILLFFTKKHIQKGGAGAQCPLNKLLRLQMSLLSLAFSAEL